MKPYLDDVIAIGGTLLVIFTLTLIANEQWLGVGIEAAVCCLVILLACTRR